MSKVIDASEAKKWSDEEWEANANYLLDRGGDVPGTANNTVLVDALKERVGEDNMEAELQQVYERKFAAVEAPEAEEAEEDPAPAKRGGK